MSTRRTTFESGLFAFISVLFPLIGLVVLINSEIKYSQTSTEHKTTEEILSDKLAYQRDLLVNVAKVLCAYMLFLAVESYRRRKEQLDEIEKVHFEMKALRESIISGDTFPIGTYYQKITDCLRKCESEGGLREGTFDISLTSFRRESPTTDPDKNCIKYHNLIQEYVNKGVLIRRLVMVQTKGKLGWVKEQARDFKGKEFSLRLYPQAQISVAIPLNIQLVGKRHVFIVFSESERDGNGGFAYICSEKIYSMLAKYYEELWKSCKPTTLIDAGKVNDEQIAKLEKEIG